MKKAAVIVAGGSGSRMGGTVPKQYLDLAGLPVIIHTLRQFIRFDPQMQIIVVLAPGHREYWEKISISHAEARGVKVVPGGEKRYNSVKNGLQYLDDHTIVGIHDAVRPFVSQQLLERCYRVAAETGSAIPVVRMEESVRMVDEQEKSSNLDRSRVRRVQTPQVFRAPLIKAAYQATMDAVYTDDAAVFELLHGTVTLVEGEKDNIKITTRTDMELASIIIRFQE